MNREEIRAIYLEQHSDPGRDSAGSSSSSRVIFHMDGDAFFVACEVAKNPELWSA